ncbi:MBL fold metallo-hydrolase [Halonotius terrestris]|uniref:MBL fold metallo-hydrolase n=1 Tax=Halonotius terrestris TaxID=2487750 RepID=A0A8J8PBQ3_9EURY|nr:MBL fold metallo-hydrolase [Halonotius terrestris]TQQ80893.1 MBL fold metallo-hydrolase [Halonotius terrestris]
MAPGDLEAVPDTSDIYYVDTGMYDVAGYGAVYIFDTDEPAVIDTGIGTNRERIFDALDELGIDSLSYVLPTHVHLDHAGGAGFLAEAFPDAEVLVHERGVDHLVDPSRLIEGTKAAVGDMWPYYTEPKPVPEERIDGLTDGDEIDLGGRTLTAHEAPGHAPHQLVFETDGIVFTGDAAGIYVADRDEIRVTSPPPQFDVQGCLDDVSMIQSLDPETLCFAHFGPRSYDERLLDGYKRTLVEWVQAVREQRDRHADDEAVIDYFVTNTELTEIWGTEKGWAETRLNVRGVLSALDQGRVDGD